MNGPTALAVVAVLTAAASWGAVALVRRWAFELRLIDMPNDRSLHARPIARGGGIGIAAAGVAGSALAWAAGLVDGAAAAWVIGPAALVAGVGLVDDRHNIDALPRLLLQLAAAAGVVWALPFPFGIAMPVVGVLPLGSLAPAAWVLWIAAFTNFFNFMDGSDGMAAAFTVVTGAGLAAAGVIGGAPLPVAAGCVISAAALGFLPHNWQPARIFMGDVGSGFLGFLLAAIPVSVGRPTDAAAGMFLLWPFVFDTTFTLIRRALKRERLWVAHRSHLYQRLVLQGWSHRAVAALYAASAAVVAVPALAWLSGRGWAAPVLLATCAAHAVMMWTLVRRSPAAGSRVQDAVPR